MGVGCDPPQRGRGTGQWREPFGPSAQVVAVGAAVGEGVQVFIVLPDRQVDDDQRVVEQIGAAEVAIASRVAPDETGRAFGEPVDMCDRVGELAQSRVARWVAQAGDVDLREVATVVGIQNCPPGTFGLLARAIGLPSGSAT